MYVIHKLCIATRSKYAALIYLIALKQNIAKKIQ